MDEQTEHLRDLFVETTGEETVTDAQTEQRGSLLDDGGEDVRAVVAALRDRFEFETDLSDEALERLVRAFYAGEEDAAIAESLEVNPAAVVEARMDLLLVRPADDAGCDTDALRERLESGDSLEAAASELGVAVDDARRAMQAREARERARETGYRYQLAFEERLDVDLSVRLTAAAREDGLREAAEDIETNVEF